MPAQDTAEAARIAAYREEKRLQEQMMISWAELRENAERAFVEALQAVEGLGHATPSRLPHRPTENAMQANFTLTTSPVGVKHAVQVSGQVASQIEGSRVHTSRGTVTVEVTNLAAYPQKNKRGVYRKLGGSEDDTSYTVDVDAFRALIQRLISAVAV